MKLIKRLERLLASPRPGLTEREAKEAVAPNSHGASGITERATPVAKD